MLARVSFLLTASLLLPLSARAGYDPPGPGPTPGGNCQSGDVVVATTASLRFNPSNVTIDSGQTICIRNDSSMPHNFHIPDVVRCAGTCASPYSPNDPGSAPAGEWVTRLTFTQVGTINFRCDSHAGVGMTGSITVQGTGGGGPGSLAFSTGNYSVGEGGGSATIIVRRTGGDDGAVSVAYATANGSATAGSDYTAASGTLNWPDGNDDNRTFTIPINNDTADEPNETVQISLSSPGGGATLGTPSSATLTINDNDTGGGPTVPAAPTGLAAEPLSTTAIELTWNDASANEAQFLIEGRTLAESFTQIGTAAANVTQYVEAGLDPATFHLFRVRATNAAGPSPYSNEAGATTDAPAGVPCVADADTLCYFSGRFKVEMDWEFSTGTSGAGQAVPLTDRSGAFYFQNAANLEMLIKMANACTLNNRYWVFFAATTNVEFVVRVTDTQTGSVKTYFNPQGVAALPVQDTSAFATCP
jgi:plastocyanin